jgi:hypothetical protein
VTTGAAHSLGPVIAAASAAVGMVTTQPGLAVVMGNECAPHDTYIQSSRRWTTHQRGKAALRDGSKRLASAVLAALCAFILRPDHADGARQRSQQKRGTVGRWLLMADDHIDGSELPLSHGLLSIMLGVQPSG